jgi:hypothetical protein
MSSDETGEIYAILRADGSPTAGGGAGNGSGQPVSPASSESDSGNEDAASSVGYSLAAVLFAVLAFVI